MIWTEQSLSSLTVKDGFRMRGENMTRIEVFSDAAFAFAVTMLVISLSTIPQNFGELIAAVFRIPSFAASFAIMMLIWITHRRWCERFGLDDGVSTFLTLALIFVVLIYVYPLKLLMDLMFYAFSQRWFPTDFQVSDTSQVALIVAIFSVGFFLIALIQSGLYLRAMSRNDDLCLNPLEQLLVRKEVFVWLALSTSALLVALMAVAFKASIGYLAGIGYSLTPVIIFFATRPTRRAIQAKEL